MHCYMQLNFKVTQEIDNKLQSDQQPLHAIQCLLII